MTVLAPNGEAAVVLPDNVLFEGGAGATRSISNVAKALDGTA
jgi:type I restriction-modification system DNA methylase subunit